MTILTENQVINIMSVTSVTMLLTQSTKTNIKYIRKFYPHPFYLFVHLQNDPMSKISAKMYTLHVQVCTYN